MIRANIDAFMDCILGSVHSLQSGSNVNPLPSAAQMSGVNYDCYIHYYIQQLNTSIA